jgi:ribonuclease HII
MNARRPADRPASAAHHETSADGVSVVQSHLELRYDTRCICGVDEAGRGPLAGPVVAAAVVLDPARPIDGLRDSKQLSAARRESLARAIRQLASGWSIGLASVEEIDRMNILQATLLAMRRAVAALPIAPTLARVDGNQAPRLACGIELIVGGDAIEPCISAASILAKTERDAEMLRLHRSHPAYGFDRHKGYPTAEHLALLRQFGPCAAHRRSFAPVREAWAAASPSGRPDEP